MKTNKRLTEGQSNLKALEIIEQLQGLAINQAIGVLKEAEVLIQAVHEVNIPNERFNDLLKFYKEHENENYIL